MSSHRLSPRSLAALVCRRGQPPRGRATSWDAQVSPRRPTPGRFGLSAGGAAWALAAALAGCAPEQQVDAAGAWIESSHDIRNGSREPQVLALLPGETLAIGWLASSARPHDNQCSATLVDADVVVTATHCVPHQTADEVVFGVGLDPSAPVAVFQVAQIIRHPERDVTLLRLTEDARRRVPELRPIPMNNADLDGPMGARLVGSLVDVAGYGETMDATRTGRWFAEVRVAEILPSLVVVDGEGRQGLCFGDSGGPLIIDRGEGLPVVAGVEHRGDDSCVGTDLMVRLDAVQDWIAQSLAPVGTADCDGIDYRGTCSGDVAVWCDANGRLARRDCAREAQACGFVDADIGFYCAPKGAAAADGIDDGRPRVVGATPSTTISAGCAQVPVDERAPLGLGALLLFAGLAGRRRPRR